MIPSSSRHRVSESVYHRWFRHSVSNVCVLRDGGEGFFEILCAGDQGSGIAKKYLAKGLRIGYERKSDHKTFSNLPHNDENKKMDLFVGAW
jgi:hypothetical protein